MFLCVSEHNFCHWPSRASCSVSYLITVAIRTSMQSNQKERPLYLTNIFTTLCTETQEVLSHTYHHFVLKTTLGTGSYLYDHGRVFSTFAATEFLFRWLSPRSLLAALYTGMFSSKTYDTSQRPWFFVATFALLFRFVHFSVTTRSHSTHCSSVIERRTPVCPTTHFT